MQRPSNRSIGVAAPGFVIAIAAIAVLVAVAGCAMGVAGVSPTPVAPSASPVATPVAPDLTPVPGLPSVSPTGVPQASAAPSPLVPATPQADGVDGEIFPLDVFLEHDVRLAISDPDGLVATASSGQAADGMSAAWGEAIVRSVGPRTIEVVWTGFPRDEVVALVVEPVADGVLLGFGQQPPPAVNDLMGADRIVILTFAEPVDAADVQTTFTLLE
jgi:hypothetical protein